MREFDFIDVILSRTVIPKYEHIRVAWRKSIESKSIEPKAAMYKKSSLVIAFDHYQTSKPFRKIESRWLRRGKITKTKNK